MKFPHQHKSQSIHTTDTHNKVRQNRTTRGINTTRHRLLDNNKTVLKKRNKNNKTRENKANINKLLANGKKNVLLVHTGMKRSEGRTRDDEDFGGI